ncbi:hypothetical protein NL676_016698 [Syzygium grande]|nr:hypothetical protein NL676_016698 [Syzygium grande]
MTVAENPPKGMMEETTACFNANAVPAQVEDVAYSQEDRHHHHHQQNVAASTPEEVDLHRHYQQQELMGFAAEDDGVVDCRNISLVTLEEVICQVGSDNNDYSNMNQLLPYDAGHSSSNWNYTAPGTEGLSHNHDDHHILISQQVAAEDDDALDCQNISHATLEEAIHQVGSDNNDYSNMNQLLPYDASHSSSNWNYTAPGTEAPQNFGNNGPSDIFAPAPPPDLPNLFNLARCSSSSLLPSSSLSFTNPNSPAPPLPFDPLIHLSNLQPQPTFMTELFQSLLNGGVCNYNNLPLGGSSSLFGGSNNMERGETEGDEENNLGMTMMYCEEDGGHPFVENNNDVSKFWSDTMADMDSCHVKVKKGKPCTTERERRALTSHKYEALKKLIPSPTEDDRASLLEGAIEYIKEFLRTVNNRKQLSFNRTLRSSSFQMKSKVTEVNVRIMDDEVTIKLVQQKKINCLLHVSKVLDELRLDLHHVAGGHIGEHYSFLLNTKIYEGSTVDASVIASKLIEVVNRQYAATPPPCRGY